MQITNNKKTYKIALYDIDYTIISINTLLAFTIFIIKKNPIKIIFLSIKFFVTIWWLLRIISTTKVKSFWLLPINGISEKKINSISKEFIHKTIIQKIKPEAIENIKDYKKKGYIIIFASASFELYIKYIAEYLDADYYVGTKIVIKNKKITTKIEGNNCKGKEKIRRILSIIPAKQIQKKGSVGYSDSKTDLPFLELVEKFYKVNLKKWNITKVIEK